MVKKFNVKIYSQRGTWYITNVTGETYEDAIRAVFSVLGLKEADVEVKMVFDGEKEVNGETIRLRYILEWPKDVVEFYKELLSRDR
ncbi:MAG: hypothetical protein DRO23_06085 [Thermoprotei archaeon]|nr:MAG: hypothetical protein DRO23_06085 [Thermoprotei archaeon]